MSKKILLIHPPLPAAARHKKIFPLGLAYLGAVIKKELPAWKIYILDAHIERLRIHQVNKQVSEIKPDVVGFSFWTPQASFAYLVSESIRANFPNVRIIHGGVHPTIKVEEAVKYADYVVLGEGELTIIELLRCIESNWSGRSADDFKKVKGIAFIDQEDKQASASKKAVHSRQNDEIFIHQTKPRPFIKDLDSLPFPAWDLFNMQLYDSPLHLVGGARLPIIGSRGCPYKCTYCVSPLIWQGQVRWRKPSSIIEEMKLARDKLGLKQFHFWDDNFLLKPTQAKEIAQLMISEGLTGAWTALTRSEHVLKSQEYLGLFKKSGCIGFEIGIESVNPDTFTQIQKSENIENLQLCGKLQREAGLYPLFTYMTFNPGETLNGYYTQGLFIDDLLKGLPWAEYFHPLPYNLYVGQFCTPHPGTALHQEAPKLGLVLAEDWSDYFHHVINFIPNSLLDDVPIRTVPRLKEIHYQMLLEAAQASIFTFYPEDCTPVDKWSSDIKFLQFIAAFYRRCSGFGKIRQIASDLEKTLPISIKESYRFSAFTAMLLAQLGLIRSAKYCTNLEIQPKVIKFFESGRTASNRKIKNRLKIFACGATTFKRRFGSFLKVILNQ